jgi:hypothetical protein
VLVFFQTKFGSPVTVPVNPAGIHEVSAGVGDAGADAALSPDPEFDPVSDELLQPVSNKPETANKQPNKARLARFLVTGAHYLESVSHFKHWGLLISLCMCI